jgi:hypothetical protein
LIQAVLCLSEAAPFVSIPRKGIEGSLRLRSIETAYRYISDVMNGHKEIPLEKWRKEYAELRERYNLEAVRIDKLSKEILAVERIMRGEQKREKDWGER